MLSANGAREPATTPIAPSDRAYFAAVCILLSGWLSVATLQQQDDDAGRHLQEVLCEKPNLYKFFMTNLRSLYNLRNKVVLVSPARMGMGRGATPSRAIAPLVT